MRDNRTGTNHNIAANGNIRKNNGACADKNAISDADTTDLCIA